MGSWPPRREDETPCPGLEADILIGISDVTREIKTSFTGLTGNEFIKARDAKAGRTGDGVACGDDPALHCQVVSLYQGGQFKLYRYHRYSDVRLVFAPEFQAAFFGGDPGQCSTSRATPSMPASCGSTRTANRWRRPTHLKWTRAAPKAG